ncbi:MAG TPA: ABC transporter permease subunit [Longimicrobiales bacterium]|nr:ABC transporter permease subunit [Longimicrobiales bacterium]
MRWPLVWTVARRDLRVVRRSRLVMLSMALVPALFLVVIPAGLALMPLIAGPSADLKTAELLRSLPGALRAALAGLSPEQAGVVYATTYMFAPMFLIVPIVVTSGIAADSFAGERERKTLEALLYTPMSDAELFAGKVVGALVPAMLVAVLGFLVYAVVVNAAGWPVMGRIFFPPLSWFILVLWVAPAVAVLTLGIVVFVSARVATAQEAFQASGLVVLPIVLLVIGQIAGVIYLGPAFVAGLGAVAWVLAAVITLYVRRRFHRTALVALT